MKNVFFRYANDDDEFVKEFSINESAWLDMVAEVDEDEILQRTDRRRAEDKRDLIKSFFDSTPSITYSLNEAVEILKPKMGLQDRQIKSYLSELSKDNKIDGTLKGLYRSSNSNEIRKEHNDE